MPRRKKTPEDSLDEIRRRILSENPESLRDDSLDEFRRRFTPEQLEPLRYKRPELHPSIQQRLESRRALIDLMSTPLDCRSVPEDGPALPSPLPLLPLSQEDAAILKVLHQAKGVTMTAELIGGEVKLSVKTIRRRLEKLHREKLVHEPEKKRGHTLTSTGVERANSLPDDAGKQLIQ
ncbi:MAG TPA: hypothetical protein VH643_17495 [Gemmataceae bacterium]|jgi:hypothetical protein